jgi:hypothetical protein
MPPVNAEHDLKRRARRRLIGAVALAVIAVIVVPCCWKTSHLRPVPWKFEYSL